METRVRALVLSKAPTPGRAKTRLAASLGDIEAARWAEAFLEDTWHALGSTPGFRPVLVLDGEGAFPGLDPTPEVWPQGTGDLGARLERAFHRALALSPAALALGSDSPGLPDRILLEALSRLSAGREAVIGPADDGGFYLIAVRRCPEGLFEGLPWSASTTGAAMQARLEHRGLSPHRLEPWYDVDDLVGLERLRADLASGRVLAPSCARRFAATRHPTTAAPK
jgi:rSAM/selenodomain-associated transferase 1